MNPNLIALLELVANVTLTAIPQTSGFVPLIQALEAAISPLIASLVAGNTKQTDVLAGYAAMIAVIETLKKQTGLAPDVLAKLDEYATAAQNGTMAALAAGNAGYDPSQLQLVVPIV